MCNSHVDVALVKLPTRNRIGSVAYANFARNNDLGNGIVVYPFLGISAVILTFGTALIALFKGFGLLIMLPLYLACVFTILHSLSTAKAAPIMLSLRATKDEEMVLKDKLNRFAFWHSIRTVFQILTFICWLWALISSGHLMYSRYFATKEVYMKQDINPKEVTHASATTTVHKYERTVYDNPTEGPVLTKIHLEESFSGDITGDGIGEVLQATNSTDNSSNFAAIERVKGKIGNKEGTFLLQVAGKVKGKISKANWFVIPGSGTGQLTRLHGKGGFQAKLGESGEGNLDYWFE